MLVVDENRKQTFIELQNQELGHMVTITSPQPN